MKYFILSVLLIGFSAQAQTAAIKDIPAQGDTTISISKGEKSSTNNFEIVDGSAEIEGDSALMTKDARVAWKAACSEWKTEFRGLNKENQILALNCNSAKCAKADSNEIICKSTATYKMKVRVK